MKDKNGNGENSGDSLTFQAMRNENGKTSGGTVTSHVEWRGNGWWWQARGPDGRSVWYPLPPSLARKDSEKAKRVARQYAARMKKMDGFRSESCDEYFDRLCATRESAGVSIAAVQQERWIWSKWIGPRIGHLCIAEVTREEIETVRDVLDEEVSERQVKGPGAGIMGSTARRVWGVVRMVFMMASRGRHRDLRVTEDDPTIGVLPPLRTRPRADALLHPAEVRALLACEHVPLKWRQAYAVAVYTFLRFKELQALRWRDVDLDQATVTIDGTRSGRFVSIQPALRPLLQGMRQDDDAPVVPVLGRLPDRGSRLLREHLLAADVERKELYEGTATTRHVSFSTLRRTGIMWLILSGASEAEVMRQAGHLGREGIMRHYTRKADADVQGKSGSAFPPIPPPLLSDPPVTKSPKRPAARKRRVKRSK